MVSAVNASSSSTVKPTQVEDKPAEEESQVEQSSEDTSASKPDTQDPEPSGTTLQDSLDVKASVEKSNLQVQTNQEDEGGEGQPPVTTDSGPVVTSSVDSDPDYWTADRMSNAKPLDNSVDVSINENSPPNTPDNLIPFDAEQEGTIVIPPGSRGNEGGSDSIVFNPNRPDAGTADVVDLSTTTDVESEGSDGTIIIPPGSRGNEGGSGPIVFDPNQQGILQTAAIGDGSTDVDLNALGQFNRTQIQATGGLNAADPSAENLELQAAGFPFFGGEPAPDVSDLAEQAINASTPEEKAAIFEQMIDRRSDLTPEEKAAALESLKNTNIQLANAEETTVRPVRDAQNTMRENNANLKAFQDLPGDIENLESSIEGTKRMLERNPGDPLWTRILEEEEAELAQSQQQLATLEQDAEVQAQQREYDELQVQLEAALEAMEPMQSERRDILFNQLNVISSQDANQNIFVPGRTITLPNGQTMQLRGRSMPVYVIIQQLAQQYGMPPQ